MKPLLAILCLNLGLCSSIHEEWRLQSAIYDWNAGREQYRKDFAKEIAEVPEFDELP